MTPSETDPARTASRIAVWLVPGGAWRSPLVSRLLRGERRSVAIAAGQRLGPFRIVDRLGEGGMATVFRAERVEGGFAQRVALKVLPVRAPNELAQALFARERAILAGLEHPGIVRLIDGGLTEDGWQWLAMELVDGERIDDWVRRAHPGPGVIVAMIRQVAEAVAYAHTLLAVHRDIKPSNVMVDARGRARLLDFGIAGLLDEEQGADPSIGACTPGYASPEQRNGEAAGVATDVFQLGLLLTDLLRIRGESTQTKTMDRRIDADPDLRAILARATATKPTDRYRTVDALIDDLDRWSSGYPVEARPAALLHRLHLFWRRHRLATAVTLAAIVTFLVLGTVSLREILLARDQAEREAATAREISRFLGSVFNAASPNVSRGQTPSVMDLLAAGVQRLETELADQPAVRGELSMVIGRVYLTLNEYEQARPLLEQAVVLGRADPTLSPLQLAMRLRLLGVARQWSHRPVDSESAFAEARDLLMSETGEPAARELNVLMRNFALLRYQQGDLAGAVDLQRQAVDRALASFGETSLMVARGRANLGQFLHNHGDESAGLRLLDDALQQLRAQLGETHPDTIAIGGAYGGMLIESGHLERGEALLEASIATGFDTIPQQSPWYPLQLGHRAWLRMMQGRLDEALDDAESALAIVERLPDADDLNSVGILETVGEIHLRRNQPEAAIPVLRRMIERNRDGRHASRVDLGQRPLLLARAYAAQGRCVEALDWLRQARTLIAARTLPSHRLRQAALAIEATCSRLEPRS